MLRILLFIGGDRPDFMEAAGLIHARIQEVEGVEVIGETGPDDDIPHDTPADVVVVLGGDGSMLRGCRRQGSQQRPIIGVNLGRLGFLTDVTPQQFCDRLTELRDGHFRTVPHFMFECRHQTGDRAWTDLGLNEVMITSAGALQMIQVHLAIDDEDVTTFSCDGLIVSTPVGSTAHNLSAGGPILRQALQAFVITPICPHALTVRPIVDSADRVYELTVPEASDGVMLVVDGQIQRPLNPGDRVQIRRAAPQFQLIRLAGHSYYGTLHRKLGWRGTLDYRHRSGDDVSESM